MARKESRTHTSIWRGDFIKLVGEHQRVYWMLYSQPTITLCGVLAYTPQRWSTLSADATEASIVDVLGALEDEGYLVLDQATEEVFVRSFMRHDRVGPNNPKIWHAAMEAAEAVLSPRIRDAIALEVARILEPDTPSDTPSDRASDTPSRTPSDEASDGVRTRAHAASSPTPTPTNADSAAADAAPKGPGGRPRNLLFEALCEEFGIDWTKAPSRELSKYRGVAADLKKIDADPADIPLRADAYKRLHPTWEFTVTALGSHWAELARVIDVSSDSTWNGVPIPFEMPDDL